MKQLSTSNFNLFSRGSIKDTLRDNSQKIFNLLTVFTTFMLVMILASLLFSSPQNSNADTTSASTGSSVYYASISNSDNVTIPVTPTSNQEEYVSKEEDGRIIFSSTCPKGSYVYINTNSTNDNALTRTGSDTGKKTIEAVAGDATSGLTDNTWGFKVNGKAFTQVPVSTSPAVLYESTKVETNTPIDILYGVKVDNNLPSGTYTNDVVYTVAVKPECLQYTLSFMDEDGTTKLYDDINVNYGDKVDLTKYTPTKTGYTFAGWSNGSSIFTDLTKPIDPNPNNDMEVMLKASYKSNAYSIFDISTMQEMTSTLCSNTTTPLVSATTSINYYSTDNTKVPEVTLRDNRDNNTYVVRKLADGKCWQMQDMKLELVANSTIEVSDGTGGGVSWTPTKNTQAVSTYKNWSSDDFNNPYSIYWSDGTAIGYTWNAATAGAGTSSSGSVMRSICPKGWMLPEGGASSSQGSWYYLITTKYAIPNNSTGYNKGIAKPFEFVAHGSGYHTRTVAGSSWQYLFSFASSRVNPAYNHGRYEIFADPNPLRCVSV